MLPGCGRRSDASGPRATLEAVSLDRFLTWSTHLTGRPNLDPEAARIFLNALLAHPASAALLPALVTAKPATAAPSRAHATLERDILAAWYTSVLVLNGQRHAASHTTALMWQAMNLPAPATCAAGAWSAPPATQAPA